MGISSEKHEVAHMLNENSFCDSVLRVCLLYMVDNVPCARGHVHVPFYEGMCPNKSHFFMNNSGTTSKWNYDGFR